MKKRKNKPGSRFCFCILTVAILLIMQGFPVFAEPVTPDQPANPVHHCTKGNDGTDYTDWSYIYFGSYPQTEVTGGDLTAAITGAAYDANGDAWVDGTKYRRISKIDTNYNGNFGDSAFQYFKWERIKWRVLQNNGSTLFVMADKGMDCKDYHDPGGSITWEKSNIRQWLNNIFYTVAFSNSEQRAIVSQTVVNEDHPKYGTEGGNDTNDNIYLLSVGEVTNPAYGFCYYGTESVSQSVKSSDYAHAMGAWINADDTEPDIYQGNCRWWLRSPGRSADDAREVNYDGDIDSLGSNVNYELNAVVPALHINLSSEYWYTTDDGTSGEGGSLVSQEPGGGSQSSTDISQEPEGDSQSPTDVDQKPEEEDNQGEQDIKVKKLSLSADSKNIAAGKKVTLNLSISPQNATNPNVQWTTSNKRYATVNSKGVVTTKKAGKGKTVTITAIATDGSGQKATIKLKLMKNAVTKVKIKNAPNILKAGKSVSLKTVVQTNGQNANKTLKWSTSNKKYATVNSKGKVTAKKAGKGKTVTITAQSTDGTNKKATVKIKIK